MPPSLRPAPLLAPDLTHSPLSARRSRFVSSFGAASEVDAFYEARNVTDDADEAVAVTIADGGRVHTIRVVAEVDTIHERRHITDNSDDSISVLIMRRPAGQGENTIEQPATTSSGVCRKAHYTRFSCRLFVSCS